MDSVVGINVGNIQGSSAQGADALVKTKHLPIRQ